MYAVYCETGLENEITTTSTIATFDKEIYAYQFLGAIRAVLKTISNEHWFVSTYTTPEEIPHNPPPEEVMKLLGIPADADYKDTTAFDDIPF